MRKLYCRSLTAIIIGLTLTGCAQQKPSVDPATAVAQLSTGAPLLRCREDCVADWRRAQPRAAQLDAAAQWSDLAALVITINYQDDLTLYYLARAAEGLGYPEAAVSYYRQSTYISGSSLSCQHESGICGGVVLPDMALARIEAIESQTPRSRPRPRRQPANAAKPPAGSKPPPPAERNPQELTPPEHETQQPVAAQPESQQPANPITELQHSPAPAPEQSRPTVSGRTDPSRELQPSAPLLSPQPARVDPIATQFIEPPPAR